MYIKNIKIQGFKSFADKTELDFNENISAIVGPNGSGKSNVVDAILWVLGEQSIKSLRGDNSMSDIIFNGSKTRDASKKASVAILFDNSDHLLSSDVSEVEIKRTIYQTGENEYYINGAKVRLKDISNILMDVTSKFNIITQGNIQALVDNKSTERRTLFESAAGVMKYKKRKEESLHKLEGTKENLTRINLIIKELNDTLDPLESQKNDAEEYLKIKSNLENIEVGLLVSEITKFNNDLEKYKQDNINYQDKLSSLNTSLSDKIESLKLESIKIDDNITELNNKLISLNEKLSKLNSEKLLTIERSKFSLDKASIDDNILRLNEEKLSLDRRVNALNTDINNLKEKLQKKINDYNIKSDEELKTRISLTNLNNEKNRMSSKIFELQNKISIENENIENHSFMPKSVRSILSNPRLNGIHDTIGNLLEVNEIHNIAIETALGVNSNFIVVNNMKCAKEAIEYLKDNNFGRATFFPLDTIKSRHLSKDIENSISDDKGYIGIASDLVNFKEEYRNIIENQLGNVIVTSSIDDLIRISKKLDYKYKMVSLDGEVVYAGGSINGGTKKESYNNRSILNNLKSDLNISKNDLSILENTIKKEESKYDLLVTSNKELSLDIASLKVEIDAKNSEYQRVNEQLNEVISNINGLNDADKNTFDETYNKILNDINKLEKDKDNVEIDLKDNQSRKFSITSEISDYENENQKNLSEYRNYENLIHNNDIEISKLEVKIDNSLNDLVNGYNITYEYAKDNYTLDMNIDDARSIVNKYKSQMKKLINVNIGAIDEYNRLKKRYDFLTTQKDDLESSSNNLLNIISEMDDIMKKKFKDSFDKISKEFSRIFRTMFKGGNGLLKLTDENDLLNTGINILAVPPGKKLNSTAALSGGEKSLTAICLIFAILAVKPAPFIIMDEVEAALDEENVNMFGEYLKSLHDVSQFILITHKKKMMEFADFLYGITMEESGVSKIVSVKLDN